MVKKTKQALGLAALLAVVALFQYIAFPRIFPLTIVASDILVSVFVWLLFAFIVLEPRKRRRMR